MMKRAIAYLTLALIAATANGQWKAQSGETYNKTFRLAYVGSVSGKETFRILRNMPESTAEKTTDIYDQIVWQLLLNNRLDKDYKVEGLVLRFDDDPKIYINQATAFKQGWDPNSMKYIIETGTHEWRTGDMRDKERKTPAQEQNAETVSSRQIIELLKSGKKVFCQIILVSTTYDTQTVLNCEFTLQNSSKSIGYLLK